MSFYFRMPHYCVEFREKVVEFVNKGHTVREAESVYNVNNSTISRWVNKKRNTQSVADKSKSGRPRVTSSHADKMMVKYSRTNPRFTARQVREEQYPDNAELPSVRTVQRRLFEAGLFGRHGVKKPLVSKKNRTDRLKWAKEHINWTNEMWSKILFSDESKFCLFGSDGIQWVRRPRSARYDPKYQTPTVKYGGGSVMIWGCFSASGVGPLIRINGTMNAIMYAEIMEQHMLPFGNDQMPVGWKFQQDNDPKHRAGHVTRWFQSNNVEVIQWPSQSPDLNPIEHLWEELDRRTRNVKVKNADEKFQLLQREWANIDRTTINRLINSMANRCREVIKNKGYATRY